MALLFVDSFDHYTTVLDKWTSKGGYYNQPTINSSYGRTAGGMLLDATDNFAVKSVSTTDRTVTAGCAVKLNAVNTGRISIISFLAPDGTLQVGIRVIASGAIEAVNGAGTLLGTSSAVVPRGAWHYVELKSYIDTSAGTVTVKIDNTAALTLTSQNTQYSGTYNYANQLKIGGDPSVGSGTNYIDDVYFLDSSGSYCNDFLGDVTVQYIAPTAVGNYSQFTPSSAVDHYTLVDENPPVTTDYVEDGTANDIDSYGCADLTPSTGTVHAVVVNMYAEKTDTGTKQVAGMARLSTTDGVGNTIDLSTSYKNIQSIMHRDPAAAAWTIANVNSSEFGVKVIA
jgi:hypothetical protein